MLHKSVSIGRIVAVAMIGALALTGCSQSTPKVATLATASGKPTAATSSVDPELKFVQCMRENGVNIPGPGQKGGALEAGGKAADPKVLDAALAACGKYMKSAVGDLNSPEMIAAMKKMSACMRKSGFEKFPDPDASGSLQLSESPEFDFNDKAFTDALKKCETENRPQQGGQ